MVKQIKQGDLILVKQSIKDEPMPGLAIQVESVPGSNSVQVVSVRLPDDPSKIKHFVFDRTSDEGQGTANPYATSGYNFCVPADGGEFISSVQRGKEIIFALTQE